MVFERHISSLARKEIIGQGPKRTKEDDVLLISNLGKILSNK